MPDEATLRAKAREAIRTGKLPDRRPDRTWGGPGVGAPCTICGEPVTKNHLEFEVQFAVDGGEPRLDKDQEALRLLIRRGIHDGRLPHDGIKKVWSSPSDGEMCDACDAILARDQIRSQRVFDQGNHQPSVALPCLRSVS
jgi:hypothetical protein